MENILKELVKILNDYEILIKNVFAFISSIIVPFLLWNLNKRLGNIQIEKHKDLERQIALELIQIIKFNLTILRKFYYSSDQKNYKVDQLIVQKDWIPKVASLKKYLSTLQINILYKLLKNIEDVKENSLISKSDFEFWGDLFQDHYINYIRFIPEEDLFLFLKENLFNILKEIEENCILSKEEKKSYDTLKKIKCPRKNIKIESTKYFQNTYENNKLKSYKLKIENFPIKLDITIDDEMKKTGLYSELNENGELIYLGEIKNDLKEGTGKFFDGNNKKVFEGNFSDDKKVEGEIFSSINNIIYFKGLFKNNNPYTGKIKIKDSHYLYDRWIYDFEGEIKEGKFVNGSGRKCTNVISGKNNKKDLDDISCKNIQEYSEAREEYDNYDYMDELPPQEREEIIKSDIISQKLFQKENLIESCDYVLEYKKVKFLNGNPDLINSEIDTEYTGYTFYK